MTKGKPRECSVEYSIRPHPERSFPVLPVFSRASKHRELIIDGENVNDTATCRVYESPLKLEPNLSPLSVLLLATWSSRSTPVDFDTGIPREVFIHQALVRLTGETGIS